MFRSLYCIIPIITQLWYLILCSISYHVEEIPVTFRFLSIVGTDVPGILNLVVLLLDPAFAAALEAILRKLNIKVPRFLDSRLPTEKLPPPRPLLDPVLPEEIDEVGYFVPMRRISPTVHSITPEPSTRCFLSNFLSCFRPHPLKEDSNLHMETSQMSLLNPTPSVYRYTHEVSSFIKRI
ncbi:hypothetical protein DSO57_1022286 [Entomophthora muscae]|uniref:Uncharacterized protein n=1 Tax=Entomophthora muscae TaxID=34485 RepID=A0ACC2RU75_9FUNG|nr:hypothetical protein DSO57_1022286 [Entomophthora muscae]